MLQKTAAKVLTPVAFTLNVVGPSYNVSDDVQLKRLPVFGLCLEQFIQLHISDHELDRV